MSGWLTQYPLADRACLPTLYMTLPDKSHWLPRPTRPGAWLFKNDHVSSELVWEVLPHMVHELNGGLWLPLVPECEVSEAFLAGWDAGSTAMPRSITEAEKMREEDWKRYETKTQRHQG